MRLIKLLIYILAVLVLLVGIAPFAGKWYILKLLKNEGYQAEIKSLGFNALSGSVSLHSVRLLNSDGRRLDIYEAEIDLNVPSLVGGWSLDSVLLDGVVVDVDFSDSGLAIGGFLVKEVEESVGQDFSLDLDRVHIKNLEVCDSTQKQCLRVESGTTARGKITFSDHQWSFQHNAPLFLSRAFLRNSDNDASIFYLDHLEIDNGSYLRRSTDIKGIVLKNIQWIDSDQAKSSLIKSLSQTQVGEFRVSAVRFKSSADAEPPSLMLGDIKAVSLRQTFVKNDSEHLPFNTKFATWFPNVYKAIVLGITEGSGSYLAIGKVVVDDGQLSWQDTSMGGAVNETVSAIQLQLEPIDNKKPSASKITLDAKLGEIGIVKFNGEIYPLGKQPKLIGNGLIQEWNLANISAYTPLMFNQKVSEGIVDVSFDVDLAQGAFELDSRWQFAGFQFALANGGSNLSLSNSMNIVKDRNESIRFSMLMSESASSDKVSVNYIFGVKIPQILRAMAKGQVETVGDLVPQGDQVQSRSQRPGKMAFRSILYQVNARSPSALDQRRLADISRMLMQKPHITMVFCPITTGGEWAEIYNNGVDPDVSTLVLPEQKQMLLDLAAARGKSLKADLIDAGVPSKQIVICEPGIDMSQMSLSFMTVSM